LTYWATNYDARTGDFQNVMYQAVAMVVLLVVALFGMLFA